MSKILKNITNVNILIVDCGTPVNANSQYTIYPQEYPIFASSSDLITYIGDGDIVVNDGSVDLSISDGVDLIKGVFSRSVSLVDSTGDSFGTPTNPFSVNNDLSPGALDAFGRQRVSEPQIIFESFFNQN